MEDPTYKPVASELCRLELNISFGHSVGIGNHVMDAHPKLGTLRMDRAQ